MQKEFESLGRTKLRVELKLRGLSPSGLKEELMQRLAQHLSSPAAANYGFTPLVNKLGGLDAEALWQNGKLPITAKESGAVVGSKRRSASSSSPPKRFKYNLDTNEDESSDGVSPPSRAISAAGNGKKNEELQGTGNGKGTGRGRKRKNFELPKQEKKKRGRKRKQRDEEEEEEEEEEENLGDLEEEIDEEEEEEANESEGDSICEITEDSDSESEEKKDEEESERPTITPLSGQSFTKEIVMCKSETIRALEMFHFLDGSDSFVFQHRYWRGSQLVNSFEVQGGTFRLLDAQKHSLKEKGGNELVHKVVLHWPPTHRDPATRGWDLHQVYSHLLFRPCIPHQHIGSPPSRGVTCGCILVSKHNAVFVQ